MLLWAFAGLHNAAAQPSTFHILKGGSVVGKVSVDRTVKGDRVAYTMTSLAQVVVIWTQDIRTSMAAEYVGGKLQSCHAVVLVNDEVRDSSNMYSVQGRKVGYIHPDGVVNAEVNTSWTTARMYYEEPVGQRSIYVESALKECPLVATGAGVYHLTLPNGHVNQYVYRSGVLHEILVDRTFFDLVFRRV